jgi:hypothetical protein
VERAFPDTPIPLDLGDATTQLSQRPIVVIAAVFEEHVNKRQRLVLAALHEQGLCNRVHYVLVRGVQVLKNAANGDYPLPLTAVLERPQVLPQGRSYGRLAIGPDRLYPLAKLTGDTRLVCREDGQGCGGSLQPVVTDCRCELVDG